MPDRSKRLSAEVGELAAAPGGSCGSRSAAHALDRPLMNHVGGDEPGRRAGSPGAKKYCSRRWLSWMRRALDIRPSDQAAKCPARPVPFAMVGGAWRRRLWGDGRRRLAAAPYRMVGGAWRRRLSRWSAAPGGGAFSGVIGPVVGFVGARRCTDICQPRSARSARRGMPATRARQGHEVEHPKAVRPGVLVRTLGSLMRRDGTESGSVSGVGVRSSELAGAGEPPAVVREGQDGAVPRAVAPALSEKDGAWLLGRRWRSFRASGCSCSTSTCGSWRRPAAP